MQKYKHAYITSWLIVLLLFGASLRTVNSGGDTIRFMGARLNIAGGSTYQLYKVTDTLAFEIGRQRVSLVSYEKTSGLYSLAGEYQHTAVDAAGSVFIVSADYLKDDYIYTSYPIGRTSLVNIKTGEKVGSLVKPSTASADYKPMDAGQLPEYRQRGLVLDEQYKITPDKIRANYQALNTYSENLFIVQAAFGLIFILLTLGSVPLVISGLKKTRTV